MAFMQQGASALISQQSWGIGGVSPQPGSALHRVLTEAPYFPRCSDDKTATRVRPREYAVRYPYMQVNRPGMVSWLIFDLDHAQAFKWQDAGLPAPNLIVFNRKSRHSHLFYAIEPVCTSERARSAPIAYMRALYDAYAERLQADRAFRSGPVAKTPGHPWWETVELHAAVYDLTKLAEHVDLARRTPWPKPAPVEEKRHSRHCLLFEDLRHHAYAIVAGERTHGSFETFSRQLETYAHQANRFSEQGFSRDLLMSSVRATVRSVARWTWDRYRGSGGRRRGVMQLDPRAPLADRQRLAAQRTHEIRKSATAAKIVAACRQLLQLARPITQAAIASATGLCRQTVASYVELVEKTLMAQLIDAITAPVRQSLQTPGTPVGLSSSRLRLHVNFAVHQVAAGFGRSIRTAAVTPCHRPRE